MAITLPHSLTLAICALTALAPAAETSHPFACTDYSQGKVFIVSAAGKAEWEYPAPTCNDLWVLPNGNLLFNTGHGVKEVTRAKEVVFDYQSKSEIYACQRLANGNTFVGECNAGRLLEVNPAGKIVKEVRLLPEGKDGGHTYMRNARALANGNYLVCHYGEQVVREYDPQGKPVTTIPAPGGPHSAMRLPNGNTLIASGDMKSEAGVRVFEVDPAGKTVWEVKNGDLPGKLGTGPHLIEITPDKQVKWTFADHQTMKTVSSVQLLDVPGDVTKGAICH
jgi:hypothetical protein